jgi:hypothetical protein
MKRSSTEGGARSGGAQPVQPRPKTSDQKLDEALALTFPASDPPAQTQPIVHVGAKTTNGARRIPTQR